MTRMPARAPASAPTAPSSRADGAALPASLAAQSGARARAPELLRFRCLGCRRLFVAVVLPGVSPRAYCALACAERQREA